MNVTMWCDVMRCYVMSNDKMREMTNVKVECRMTNDEIKDVIWKK